MIEIDKINETIKMAFAFWLKKWHCIKSGQLKEWGFCLNGF